MRHAVILRRAASPFIYTIPTGFESTLCYSNYAVALHRRAKVCVQQPASHIVDVPIACTRRLVHQEVPSDVFLRHRTLEVLLPATSASWRQLQTILWLCESRGVQAHLVMYPYHAQFLQLIKVDGRWPLYEQWKRTLVNVVERAREGNENHTLWDFSGYHRYSTETIPKNGDNQTVMQWYWEAGHFKRELGERILHRVFGGGDPNFGVQLTAANIQRQLDAIKAAQLDYERANPTELEQLRALTRRMRRTSETEQAKGATADVVQCVRHGRVSACRIASAY